MLCVAGGMATQAAVAKRWKEVTGTPIIEGYGLSETSPVVCVNRSTSSEFTGTIGYAGALDRRRRSATTTAMPCRSGERGRILRARAAGDGGLLAAAGRDREGDDGRTAASAPATSACMDADGYVRIVDRMKDMILVSGFNVYPNEVEDVLAQHPGVLEARGRSACRTSEGVRRSPPMWCARSTSADGARTCANSARESHRLQGAEATLVPRQAAEDQCRQGAAARAAGRGPRAGRLNACGTAHRQEKSRARGPG